MDHGVAHGALSIHAELLAIDRFRERDSHCLQLCISKVSSLVCIRGSKHMATQMTVLVEVRESQK